MADIAGPPRATRSTGHAPGVAARRTCSAQAVPIAWAECPPSGDEDQYGPRIPRVTYTNCDNDNRMIRHGLDQMKQHLRAAGARDIFRLEDDTNHLHGTARMGFDPRTSVVNADCRSWDIPDLWICDGSVFPTAGGVNPSETIRAITCRTADRIRELGRRGKLWQPRPVPARQRDRSGGAAVARRVVILRPGHACQTNSA